VRQHLASLLRRGLVVASGTRSSLGRPNRLYLLTSAGKESFPRHYSWFAQLLVEAMVGEHGAEGLRTRLGRIAAAVVTQLDQDGRRPDTTVERIERIAALMDQLGYDAQAVRSHDRAGARDDTPVIEADNCVFHELAQKQPEVCHFDLALLSSYTGTRATLHECMARGGHVCRFRFTPHS
jgi:predicted ArsR family transcriptional regulator